MKIQHVTFLGVHGVADASYDFTNPQTGAPHDVVVVTGGAASGKTRFLEALVAAKEAIAPYGPPAAPGAWIARGAPAAKIALGFWLDDEERTYANAADPVAAAEATFTAERARGIADEGLVAVLGRYTHERRTGKLEYFPATRRLPTLGPFGGLHVLEQRIARAGKDPRKYGFVVRFLRDLAESAPLAEAFAHRLAALSSTCRYERERAPGGVPRCLRSRGQAPVPPHELSDGEQDAVLIAATAVAIELVRSLVLVDRPDLFADPTALRALVAGLRGLGDDNQLFLASSSPDLVAAAEPAYVVRLEGA
jgi:energy-coupling factor transporter ATP-binding protein EcfA2